MCVRLKLTKHVYMSSMSIFIGCWPWSTKVHTHRWRQIHVRSRQQTCFSFVIPPKFFNKPFEFLLYKTNRLHFPVCVYCNRSQKTSQRVKNNSHATRICLVSYFLFFCLYITDYSTHARKIVIYLLYIPNSEVWYIYRMQVH